MYLVIIIKMDVFHKWLLKIFKHKLLFAGYKELKIAELQGAADDCFDKEPGVTDLLGTKIHWLPSFFPMSFL